DEHRSDRVQDARAGFVAEPGEHAGERQGDHRKHDGRLVGALCTEIVRHCEASFFARAIIRSAKAIGSTPAAAAVASICLARLSTCNACARAPSGRGGSATKLPRPLTRVIAPVRSNSSYACRTVLRSIFRATAT